MNNDGQAKTIKHRVVADIMHGVIVVSAFLCLQYSAIYGIPRAKRILGILAQNIVLIYDFAG